MKKVITTLLFATALSALTGCAGLKGNTKIGEPEKTQIKEGKLIAFSQTFAQDTKTARIDNKKLKDGIYICATSYAPSKNCYTHLSAVIAKYFTDSGVKVAKDRGASDVVMYFGINFGYYYQNIAASKDKYIMDEMESSLANNNALSVNISDPKYTPASVAAQNKENFRSNAVTALSTGFVAVATNTPLEFGVSTGERPACDWMCSNQAMFFYITEYDPITGNKLSVDSLLRTNDIYQKLRIYDGPIKASDAFPTLFDKAMKETVADIISN